MDDAACERLSQGLRHWLETVAASERSPHDRDRFEISVGLPGTRRALVIERAGLLTGYIRARTMERQLRCEVHRIAVRHQVAAASDMRHRIEALSRKVHVTPGSA